MKRKIKAGILQLTLGISFVIATLCGAILLLAYYQRLSYTQQKISELLSANCNSAVAYFMSARSSLKFNEAVRIDLYGEEIDSVEITRKPWGLFEMASVRAWRGNTNDWKNVLITSTPSAEGKASLYLPDKNTPLYLVGETKIEGTVFLSERKFSTGYIDGKGYTREKLFEGQVKKSGLDLPPLDTTLLYKVKQILATSGEPYVLTKIESLVSGAYLFNPSPSYFFSEQGIDLKDSVRGGIVIHSLIKIRIHASARIEDAILIAPFIDIDHQVEGSMQCFASRQITVGEDSKLHYPSALALTGGEQDSSIVIQKNAFVQGLILIPGANSIADKGKLKIDKDAFIQGSAYVNGAVQMQGVFNGNLIARSVQVAKSDVEYNNHLMDAVITPGVFKGATPGSLLWASGKGMVIAKWIP